MVLAEKKITVQEYLKMDFEGEDAYYELINGHIVKKSSPSTAHQRISGRLFNKMYSYVESKNLGEVFHPPIDVFLDKYNHVIPDITFVHKTNNIIDNRDGIIGAPDLIVEIISPSSVFIDREDKKLVYEKVGVKEYWLIDPRYNSVEIHQNKNGRYQIVSSAIEDGKVQSIVLEGFEVEIKELFPS